jgi:hypothetical protein
LAAYWASKWFTVLVHDTFIAYKISFVVLLSFLSARKLRSSRAPWQKFFKVNSCFTTLLLLLLSFTTAFVVLPLCQKAPQQPGALKGFSKGNLSS